MPVDTYSGTLPASGVFKLPNPANFFFLLNASSALTVQFQGGLGAASSAANETFQGLSAGLRVQRLKSWANCNLVGTPATTFTVFYGTETPREDSTDYVQTIATIAGNVVTVPGAMTGGLTDHTDVTVGASTIDTTIAANAARKFVLVGSFSTNNPVTAGANLRVGGASLAVNQGVELQPGQFISYQENTAIHVNNPDTASQKYWWQELL
jgi:hypothetical protein